jgi:uncharacterized repeat protein (TIGR01451 family)
MHPRKALSILLLLALLASLVSNAQAQPASQETEYPTALVYIPLTDESALQRFSATGLPAYTRLQGKSEAYLLAGANTVDQARLEDAGLAVSILDPDTRGAKYFLAYSMPGRKAPAWNEYGILLHNDGLRVLLRLSPSTIPQLSRLGVELQALTLTPKPLATQPAESPFPSAVDPDPLVQMIINQISSDTVLQYNRELAGELPVWVDGEWYTIPTRYTYSGTPIQKATRYVGQKMEDLGLDVEYHVWNSPTNPNVIGEITGLTNPDDIFILGAHIDDVQGTPGADDNASGSNAVEIAVELLSQYQWGCTVRFAFWTGEEQGLLGSQVYAQRSFNAGENIVGYLNLDMIAYNTLGSSPDIDLHANQSLPQTLVLAQLFADIVDAYNLNLIPQIVPNGSGASDHASFWQYGYTAILGIEDFSDFNPYYHGAGDTPANNDLGYFTEFVKASIATFIHMSGCLLPTGIGSLDGTVTVAGSGLPIEGASVTAVDPNGHSFPATTDVTGYYTRTLVADTYTVTAAAYGYLPETVTGVTIVTDTVTTQDFSLAVAPTYTVSGTVTEAGSGLPLYAQVSFEGSPVAVYTDPATGFYQATLPQGNYTMHVAADLHRPEQRSIVLDQDQTQNFSLLTLPCILLVDDDNNSPDTLPYFTTALDTLGYEYDVYDVSSSGGNGPPLDQIQGYTMVIWFSGDTYGGAAGPNSIDEDVLIDYLNGGGKLFLSSQDYLYDMGLTPFGQVYLGIGSFFNDSGNAVTKYSVPNDPIGGGLGPYPLSYPTGFSDYGDIVNAGAGASVAFRSASSGGNNLDIDKAGVSWKTVFFGTDWVAIQHANPANGAQVLQRIIDWFGGCECEPVNILSLESDSPAPFGQPLHFTSQVTGTLPIEYQWDFGGDGTPDLTDPANPSFVYDLPGVYTATLTALNNCSVDTASLQVEMLPPTTEATWHKEIWINAQGPFPPEAAPFGLAVSDTLTIIDRVWVSDTQPVSGGLAVQWEPFLALESWQASAGQVFTASEQLNWSLDGADPGSWLVLTKTFTAQTGEWVAGLVTETLSLEGLDPQLNPLRLDFYRLWPDLTHMPSTFIAELFPGDVATQVLTIGNTGFASLEWALSASPPVGWLSFAPTGGSLSPTSAQPVNILFETAGLDIGIYTTTLELASNDPDEAQVTIPVTLTLVQPPQADLALAVSAYPESVHNGDLLTYTLTITNIGPDDVSQVILTDTLPTGVSPLEIPASCQAAAGIVVCNLGELASKTSIKISLVVQVLNGTGWLVNQAVVSADIFDPDLNNNLVTTQIPILFHFYLPAIYRE